MCPSPENDAEQRIEHSLRLLSRTIRQPKLWLTRRTPACPAQASRQFSQKFLVLANSALGMVPANDLCGE